MTACLKKTNTLFFNKFEFLYKKKMQNLDEKVSNPCYITATVNREFFASVKYRELRPI